MAVVATTLDELVEREDVALARVVALAERVDPSLSVGDGTWSARDVVAHLVTVIRRYVNPDVRLSDTARGVDEVNAEELRELAGLSTGELATALADGQRAYQELWTRFPLEAELRFHAGLRFDAATLRCNWISELLVHGYDVAVAAGEDWPLSAREGLLALRVTMRALPGYLSTDGLEGFALAFAPDGGNPQSVVVEDGALVVSDGEPAAPTARLSGPPAALALMFYGRVPFDASPGLVVDGDRAALDRFLAARDLP